MKFNIFQETIDKNQYYIATYKIKSKTNLKEASWNLAIGQSVGNPNVRNEWETEELFNNHSCLILANEKELELEKEGFVKVAQCKHYVNVLTYSFADAKMQGGLRSV